MAITLGKDCSVGIGGTIASARSATFSTTAKTIEIDAYGSRLSGVYSVGYDASVSVELLDGADAAALVGQLQDGTQINVTGGSGGWSFPAVVTSISESDPIDGVATFTIEAKLTIVGVR